MKTNNIEALYLNKGMRNHHRVGREIRSISTPLSESKLYFMEANTIPQFQRIAF